MADGIIALLATVYSVWVIIAGTADLKTFMYGMILLASGILFYRPKTKKKKSADQKTKRALSA